MLEHIERTFSPNQASGIPRERSRCGMSPGFAPNTLKEKHPIEETDSCVRPKLAFIGSPLSGAELLQQSDGTGCEIAKQNKLA